DCLRGFPTPKGPLEHRGNPLNLFLRSESRAWTRCVRTFHLLRRATVRPATPSPDEFPTQHSPACTFGGCFDLSARGRCPKRFAVGKSSGNTDRLSVIIARESVRVR